MNNYRAVLHHDNGYKGITVTAKDKPTAINMLMKAEGCPEGAIQTIMPEDDLIFTLKNEVSAWVDKFNYIQVHVLNKMCDDMLFEYIRSTDIDSLIDDWFNYKSDDEKRELVNEFESVDTIGHLDIEDLDSADKAFIGFKDWLEETCEDQIRESENPDSNYPMWNTCFEFKENPSEDVIQAAIDAGFGVIEGLDEFNPILFVAGCGYSFYGAHWIPMYLDMPWNLERKEFYKGINYSNQ